MEKRFLVYQTFIEKNKNNWDNKIGVNTLIRNVGAINENEALGKFINETKDIVSENMIVEKKLDPIVFELNNLIKID
jgi:hypothetical protein